MPSGQGPLIPGLEEFDVPRRPWPRWLVALIGVVAVVAVTVPALGFVAGVGPMRGLGLHETVLQPLAFRPTTNEAVIQVAVGVPADGICPDAQIVPAVVESPDDVRVAATLTQGRDADCGVSGAGTQEAWIDVLLGAPLGERTVVRDADGVALPRATDLA